MSDKPRILFCATGYGAGNIGDDAILLGLHESLRLNSVDCETGVVSFSPSFTRSMVDMNEFWQFDNEGLIKGIKWATHVVLGGASLISERPVLDYPIKYCCTIIKLAKLHKKPVAAVGVGVSDIVSNEAVALIRNNFIRYLEIVSLRSKRDYDKCIALGFDPEQIVVTADGAFAIYKLIGKKGKTGDSSTIGLNLVSENQEKKFDYPDKVASTLLEYSNEYSFKGICNEVRKDPVFDYALTSKVINTQLNGITFCNYVNPFLLIEELQKCKIIITMRMHMLIFCAMAGIPCLPLVRELKTELMAKELKLSNFFYLSDSKEKMDRSVAIIVDNPDTGIVRPNVVTNLYERAVSNGGLINKWLKGHYIERVASKQEREILKQDPEVRVFMK